MSRSQRSNRRIRPQRPNVVRCPVSDKVRFSSRRSAQEALDTAQIRAALSVSLGAPTVRRERRYYWCSNCRGFHLTSWTRRRYEESRRRQAAA